MGNGECRAEGWIRRGDGGRCRMRNWVGARVGRTQVRAMLKLLFIGDIVGRPGRDMVIERVPRLRTELGLDFVIANAENVAAGAGITEKLAKSILDCGVDAITLGDHVWDQRGWETEIVGMDRVCRPANLPKSCGCAT